MIPLVEEEDKEILMHREVHFAGSFQVMLDYYKLDGKGALLDEHRVEQLAKLPEDPAPLILSQADYEAIANAQGVYSELRQVYETDNKQAKLIADLILSEEDEEEVLAKVIKEGETMVPHLIDLLRTPHFHLPLAPGYGYAPSLAARALGEIGDTRAIIPLFEALGTSAESAALDALPKLPAKQFLLDRLAGPLTPDTENAALALSAFPEDADIAEACLALLKEHVQREPLSVYLAIGCSGLPDKEPLRELLERDLPETLRYQIAASIASGGPSQPTDSQQPTRD